MHVAVVGSGRGRRASYGAAPPTSSPLRVPIRPAPPRVTRWAVTLATSSGSSTEGPGGSGVNGLTPGPLRLLVRQARAGQEPAAKGTRLPLPPLATGGLGYNQTVVSSVS